MPARRPRSILSAALVLAALLWLALALPPATAHGTLERSDPVSSASVDVPPRQVVLWFSEPVDPAFTSATVTDDQGRRVSRAAALSAEPPGPRTVAVRGAAFLGAIVLAGSIFFQVVVLHQALRGTDAEIAATVRATTTPRLRRLQVSAAPLLAISAIGGFALTATSLMEMPLLRALRRGLLGPLLLDTKVGWSILIIIPFTVLLLLPPSRSGRIVRSGGLILIVGLAGLAALFRGPASLRESGHGLHLVVTVGFAAAYALVTAVRRPPAVDWISAVVAAGLLARSR